MKLKFKKLFEVEADVERLVEKGMDNNAKKQPKKTRYQIRQEEKRKNQELKHKQEMQKVYIGLTVLGVIIFICVVMGILSNILGWV
ncbi:MAG: hypothetical protein IJA55_10535 [Clostridia bacterium]|nr:hypothetical protein [Clostridia bacterium]